MINPVQKPGGDEFSPLNKPTQNINQPKPKGKNFQDIQSGQKESPKVEAERQKWWGGYFSPKELYRFKENLLKFLSSQLKYEMQQAKKAEEKLKESEKGR